MASFRYEGTFPDGAATSGVVDANSREDAILQIRRTCSRITMIKEIPKAANLGNIAISRRAKITSKSLALTCKQFGIILRAGLPLVQTVTLVAEQTSDKGMQTLLTRVAEDVGAGWSLSHALNEHGSELPITFREAIRAGEESGDLADSFERMAKYYDRSAKTKAKMISAISYPAFVVVVAIAVIAIIMIYAVPSFTQTFESMGIDLPWPTKLLIGMSNFTQQYGILIGVLLLVIVAACVIFSRSEKGGLFFSRLLLSMPILGSVVQMAGASQFAHTMSSMLASGMQILGAMDVSGRVVASKLMSREIMSCIPGVESGRTLGECLAETGWMPRMLVQMVGIGESSGSMEYTLQVLAEYYDNEVQVKSDRALALLEPIIICVLAVFVVLILFAVYLPMFSMSQGVSQM